MRKRLTAWLAATVLTALLLYLLLLYAHTPSISDIRKTHGDEPAHLVAADGRLLAEYHWVHRQWVPLDKIAEPVIDALIATEDHRFYQHPGMDWRRTLASVIHTAAGRRQGGSTLTQQLARNLYPKEIGRAPTLTRKLKEAMTAFKIEWSYSKDEILEIYLNTVPFLHNAWGIEMAARTYFDQSADKLTVLESATLIGMLKGSAYYNPLLHPQRAQMRRDTVLGQMKKRGKLSTQHYEMLRGQPLHIRFTRQYSYGGLAPHLAGHLRPQLIDWADRHGYSLYFDGLVIHTSIDGNLQELATRAVQRHSEALQGVADNVWVSRAAWNPQNPLVQQLVRESGAWKKATDLGESPDRALAQLLQNTHFLHELRWSATRVRSGLMALDPRSGAVRAWVGSRDPDSDPYDQVQVPRHAAASVLPPLMNAAALVRKSNAVTLAELVAAYATIARGGLHIAPTIITRIEDKHGNVLESFAPTSAQYSVEQASAQHGLDSLRGIARKSGVADLRARYGITADMAGRGGSAPDRFDTWFVLLHPQLVAGVWSGFHDPRIGLHSDYWSQPEQAALPIVGEVFRQALHAGIIDADADFAHMQQQLTPIAAPAPSAAPEGLRHWFASLWKAGAKPPQPAPVTAAQAPPPPPAAQAPPPADIAPTIASAPLLPLQEVMLRPTDSAAQPVAGVVAVPSAPAP